MPIWWGTRESLGHRKWSHRSYKPKHNSLLDFCLHLPLPPYLPHRVQLESAQWLPWLLLATREFWRADCCVLNGRLPLRLGSWPDSYYSLLNYCKPVTEFLLPVGPWPLVTDRYPPPHCFKWLPGLNFCQQLQDHAQYRIIIQRPIQQYCPLNSEAVILFAMSVHVYYWDKKQYQLWEKVMCGTNLWVVVK